MFEKCNRFLNTIGRECLGFRVGGFRVVYAGVFHAEKLRVKALTLQPLPSKDSYFKAIGPKDPIISGFWAILMLRVRGSPILDALNP